MAARSGPKPPRGTRGQLSLAAPQDAAVAPGDPIPGLGVRRRAGGCERAVQDALRASRERPGGADPRWVAAAAAAKALARAVDAALSGRDGAPDPYAVAQTAPRLLEALRELQLTPASAGDGTDPLGQLLGDLGPGTSPLHDGT